MNEITIEQIMTMPERERIALIFRLAMYSEKPDLAKDIERVIGVHHGDNVLQNALDNSKRPKAW